MLGSPLVVVVVPLVSFAVRRERMRRSSRAVVARRTEAAAEFVAVAASGLRAGRSLAGAILSDAGRVAERPSNDLRQAVIERVNAGHSLVRAVGEVMSASSEDERLIAATIRVLDATGGSAESALERVNEALAERRSAREDARTQAQHALSSASLLASLPVVFGSVAAVAEPAIASLYVSTWIGAGCVGAALVLTIGSWEWLQRLLGSEK